MYYCVYYIYEQYHTSSSEAKCPTSDDIQPYRTATRVILRLYISSTTQSCKKKIKQVGSKIPFVRGTTFFHHSFTSAADVKTAEAVTNSLTSL